MELNSILKKKIQPINCPETTAGETFFLYFEWVLETNILT
jgi:hypothetical protein